ncbi:MAG: SdpI family protein [Candidatus Komeilibacteria bacterium]|nr:SdpI family protein [Candidatus Komeilibacteria bacterium]
MSIILGCYFYSVFPDRVPMHWNINGQVDSWGSAFSGAFILPMILIGMYILFVLIPFIDPKKEKYEQFAKVYKVFRILIMLVMFGVYLIASANALGYAVRVEIWIPVIIGLLFMVMGNYFGKIKPNWFMGIRTPWTLSSEEVWNKTHRLGGKLFMILGLLMLITPFWHLPSAIRFWLVIIPVLLVALVPMVYSYVIYKRIKK